jgi:Family of unknown function (DUF6069)
MTTTTTANPTSTAIPTTTAALTLWKAGVVSGLVSAVATTVTAAVARAADVPLAVKGEAIPIAGFAQLTFVGAMLGLVLAKVLSRRAANPRRTFMRTTVLLTAFSIVPDFLAEATTASRVVLAATHLIAAVIIVPSIASRLAD